MEHCLELTLDHRLDQFAHPVAQPASIGSNQSSRRWTAVSASEPRTGDFVLLSGMAWSPPAHNAGIVGFSAPGDYATFNSNHTPDGTLEPVALTLVSHRTLRWRKADSNSRSPLRQRGLRGTGSGGQVPKRDKISQGLNLRGIKMDRAVLRGADFTGAHLQSANLIGAILQEACFDRADLSRARLSGANLVVLLSNMTRINFPFPLPGARSDIG